MENDKTIYWIAVLLIVIYLHSNQSIKPAHQNVLPEAGYCISNHLEISYTTISSKDYQPYEYCQLDRFCELYEATSVLNTEVFDQELLDDFESDWESKGYECFQDEAKHSQREFNRDIPNGTYVKSKFLCCYNSTKHGTGKCEGNVCNGRYTGITDDYGCKLYAKQLCRISTNCELTGDRLICDPQPYTGGSCTFVTSQLYGKTTFTKFTDCNLEAEEICGTEKDYCCDSTCNVPCTAVYDSPINKYVAACGWYIKGGVKVEP